MEQVRTFSFPESHSLKERRFLFVSPDAIDNPETIDDGFDVDPEEESGARVDDLSTASDEDLRRIIEQGEQARRILEGRTAPPPASEEEEPETQTPSEILDSAAGAQADLVYEALTSGDEDMMNSAFADLTATLDTLADLGMDNADIESWLGGRGLHHEGDGTYTMYLGPVENPTEDDTTTPPEDDTTTPPEDDTTTPPDTDPDVIEEVLDETVRARLESEARDELDALIGEIATDPAEEATYPSRETLAAVLTEIVGDTNGESGVVVSAEQVDQWLWEATTDQTYMIHFEPFDNSIAILPRVVDTPRVDTEDTTPAPEATPEQTAALEALRASVAEMIAAAESGSIDGLNGVLEGHDADLALLTEEQIATELRPVNEALALLTPAKEIRKNAEGKWRVADRSAVGPGPSPRNNEPNAQNNTPEQRERNDFIEAIKEFLRELLALLRDGMREAREDRQRAREQGNLELSNSLTQTQQQLEAANRRIAQLETQTPTQPPARPETPTVPETEEPETPTVPTPGPDVPTVPETEEPGIPAIPTGPEVPVAPAPNAEVQELRQQVQVLEGRVTELQARNEEQNQWLFQFYLEMYQEAPSTLPAPTPESAPTVDPDLGIAGGVDFPQWTPELRQQLEECDEVEEVRVDGTHLHVTFNIVVVQQQINVTNVTNVDARQTNVQVDARTDNSTTVIDNSSNTNTTNITNDNRVDQSVNVNGNGNSLNVRQDADQTNDTTVVTEQRIESPNIDVNEVEFEVPVAPPVTPPVRPQAPVIPNTGGTGPNESPALPD